MGHNFVCYTVESPISFLFKDIVDPFGKIKIEAESCFTDANVKV
jgi:hypothetical protein